MIYLDRRGAEEVSPKATFAQNDGSTASATFPKLGNSVGEAKPAIGYRAKRFASSDFMRGLAIVAMLLFSSC